MHKAIPAAPCVGVRIGERPSFVSEKLALEERLGYCAAVDRDEGLVLSPTGVVERARDELLARPALALNQDRRLVLGNLADRREDFPDRIALPENPVDGLLLAHGLLERAVLASQRFTLFGFGERQQDFVLLEGLRDVVVGAGLHRFDRQVDRAVRAHQDHRRQGRARLQFGAELDPGHPAHADVGKHEVRIETLQLLQRGLGTLGRLDLVVVLLEQRAEHEPDVFFIVDD